MILIPFSRPSGSRGYPQGPFLFFSLSLFCVISFMLYYSFVKTIKFLFPPLPVRPRRLTPCG